MVGNDSNAVRDEKTFRFPLDLVKMVREKFLKDKPYLQISDASMIVSILKEYASD